MHRRILQWMARHRIGDWKGLLQRLKVDDEFRKAFQEYLTINTSQFFRDIKVFETIKTDILPELNRNPKIWSAACSIGAEPYSIAILLLEQGFSFSPIFATDINEVVLAKAKKGIFMSNQISGVPASVLGKYFIRRDDKYQIVDEVKRKVEFKQHNLLVDEFGTDYDLILCRNVFIYFKNETQAMLTERFVDALKDGGFFIVGSAEQIMNPASYNLVRKGYCIYQKAG